jgi:hypothetical protein
MQHFELSLKEEIDIYINNNITPTELFVIRLLLLAADGEIRPLVNYISNISEGKQLFRDVLSSLKNKINSIICKIVFHLM